MEIPIIKCFETDNNWVFWCPWCKRLHAHGKGEGYRCAHCHTENSPFDETGYTLKKFTKKEKKMLGIKSE
jgi:tRNA(Ile2) C34 agmatinyltransferase TiaS